MTTRPPEGGDDAVLTVTCRDAVIVRDDLPMLRWFEATLSLQDPAEVGQAVEVAVAHAQVVLIGLGDGLDEAFLQADGYSGVLAAPMEDLLRLDRDGTLALIAPAPRTVLIIEQIDVPEAVRGRGHGTRLLQQLAAHFGFLAGPGLMLAIPSPDQGADLDPFTLRVATRRLEKILADVGLHQIPGGSTWWATYSDATPRYPR